MKNKILTILAVGLLIGPMAANADLPCSVSADPSAAISKKNLTWGIENTGTVDAIIESIDVTWPAINRDLRKIKLGQTTIVKEKSHRQTRSFTRLAVRRASVLSVSVKPVS